MDFRSNLGPESGGENTLTAREVEVLGLMAHGLVDKEIAHRLCIAEQTAKNHVANIRTKFSAGTREEAVLNAVKSGSFTPRLTSDELTAVAIVSTLPQSQRDAVEQSAANLNETVNDLALRLGKNLNTVKSHRAKVTEKLEDNDIYITPRRLCMILQISKILNSA